MDLPERLWRFIADPSDVAIEDALLAVAGCRPGVDVDHDAAHVQLDQLAGAIERPDTAAICTALFGSGGFRGDQRHYHDPRNSLLDVVLDRRVGMPITLSVVAIAVARRCGVELDAIGAPGHFLIRDRRSGEYRDPFNGGMVVDTSVLRARVGQMVPVGADVDAFLGAVGPFSIVGRVLNNLQNSYSGHDPSSLDWVLDLRLALPDALQGDERVLATLCERRGRFDQAAGLLDRLGRRLDDDGLRRRALALSARLN